jgi:hypothetical protein
VKIVRHRRNTIAELAETPSDLGIEVDIRSRGDELLIHHDPFVPGEPFDAWIKAYRHGLLILNVKEEGLEDALLDRMRRHRIDDFFFLDQSFPFLIKTARKGEHRCAVRVSEFESPETALSLKGMVDWIWVDYFSGFPLDAEAWSRLVDAGFRMCLVSPELQGFDALEIAKLRDLLAKSGMMPDAVCTKHPGLWCETTVWP